MPYIDRQQREWIDNGAKAQTAGQLNYGITRRIVAFLGPRPRYDDFNAVLGVLTAVQHEVYRRMVAPYEEAKRAENGDVFPQKV